MNPTEFANSIRTKYPGAYDHVDDVTLSKKVVEKYPVYADRVSFESDSSNQSPSLLGKVTDVWNKYRESPLYKATPVGLLQSMDKGVRSIFNKAGEATAEYLGSKQVNPNVSAGVGTILQMTPDIVSSFAGPVLASPSKEVPSMAVPYARRALGFQKSLLKTPFARGQAQMAARTALENDVIPLSGNPSVALENATELASKVGQKVGDILESKPADLTSAFDDLENLRSALTQNTSEGIYAGANEAIDKVQKTIVNLMDQENVTTKSLNAVKNRIGNSLNYLADSASQSDNKKIVSALGSTIRKIVKALSSPEEFVAFRENQKLFNAAKLMEKGLNNEVAGQMGNRLFSPLSVVPATGELAAGNPGRALTALGVGETLLRRAAGTTARALTDISRSSKYVPGAAATVLKKILDEKTAMKYLEEANDDPNLARKLAEKDGWTIP